LGKKDCLKSIRDYHGGHFHICAQELAELRLRTKKHRFQITDRDVDSILAAWQDLEYSERREALVGKILEAAQRLHDECSVLRLTGERLNRGPMLEPGEDAVLNLRDAFRDLQKFEEEE